MVWNRVGRDVRRWEWKGKMALGGSLQAASWDRFSLHTLHPCFTSSTTQHSPPHLSSRSRDNALYTLITLSEWRALCWVLSKPINMKVCATAVAPTERGSKEVRVYVCIEDLGKQGKRECSSWNRDIRINGQALGGSAHARELWDTRLMDPLSQEGWYTIVSLFRKTGRKNEREERVEQFLPCWMEWASEVIFWRAHLWEKWLQFYNVIWILVYAMDDVLEGRLSFVNNSARHR